MKTDPHAALLAELRTCKQVADLFGVTTGRIRHLAQERQVGHRIGDILIFTPADVEALRPGRPGRRSMAVLKGIVKDTGHTHN